MAENSPFRLEYRELNSAEVAKIALIKSLADNLHNELLELKKTSARYASLAITDLESSVTWAVKGITEPPVDPVVVSNF